MQDMSRMVLVLSVSYQQKNQLKLKGKELFDQDSIEKLIKYGIFAKKSVFKIRIFFFIFRDRHIEQIGGLAESDREVHAIIILIFILFLRFFHHQSYL